MIKSALTAFIEDRIIRRREIKERFTFGYEFRAGHYDWRVKFHNDRVVITRDANRFSHSIVLNLKGDKVLAADVVRGINSRGRCVSSATTTSVVYGQHIHETQAARMIRKEMNHLPTIKGQRLFLWPSDERTVCYGLAQLDAMPTHKLEEMLVHLGLGYLSPRWDYGMLSQELVTLAHRTAERAPVTSRKRLGAEMKRLINEGVISEEPHSANQVHLTAGPLFTEYVTAAMSVTKLENAVARVEALTRLGIWNYNY